MKYRLFFNIYIKKYNILYNSELTHDSRPVKKITSTNYYNYYF